MGDAKKSMVLEYLFSLNYKIRQGFPKENIRNSFYLNHEIPHKMDFRKDAQGNEITPGHKFYELSKAAISFQEGRKKKDLGSVFDSEKFFKEKGEHYCAGYLSRFGEVIGINLGEDDFDVLTIYLGRFLRKTFELKKYRVAKKIWSNSFS